MGWTGKIIGGGIGFVFGGGLAGAIIGAVIGHHIIDSRNTGSDHSPGDIQRKQHIFLVTTFSMLAKLSKADGRVSQEEINAIEFFMTHELRLDSSARQKAIEIFTKAKDSSDSFEDHARRFYAEFQNNPEILGLLIDLLTRVAHSDGGTHAAEKAMIEKAVHIFGLGAQYRQMMDDEASSLDRCYALLGAERGDSLSEIKKKYRKLAMKYHPNRIHAEGVHPDLAKVTEQKFKDIQNAYEEIEKHLAQ